MIQANAIVTRPRLLRFHKLRRREEELPFAVALFMLDEGGGGNKEEEAEEIDGTNGTALG
jgi:hypothetical protein